MKTLTILSLLYQSLSLKSYPPRTGSKMTEVWIGNGVMLGWLVDVDSEKLWIYRQNGTVDLIEGFDQPVSGEDVVPGFEFDLRNLM